MANRGKRPLDPYLDANILPNVPAEPPAEVVPIDRPEPYAQRLQLEEIFVGRRAKRRRGNSFRHPRLGQADFTVDHYVSHYPNFVDAYRFGQLQSNGDRDGNVLLRLDNGAEVRPHSRGKAWYARWAHIGNLVKDWNAPDFCEMPWIRTREEFEYVK